MPVSFKEIQKQQMFSARASTSELAKPHLAEMVNQKDHHFEFNLSRSFSSKDSISSEFKDDNTEEDYGKMDKNYKVSLCNCLLLPLFQKLIQIERY